jgi:hypothetical protein
MMYLSSGGGVEDPPPKRPKRPLTKGTIPRPLSKIVDAIESAEVPPLAVVACPTLSVVGVVFNRLPDWADTSTQ